MLAENGLTQVAEDVYIRPMLTIQRATDLYLGDLSRAGRRDRTTRSYGRILDDFVGSLPIDTDVAEIRPDDVRRFLDRQLRKKEGTQAQKFSVLKCFFEWARRNEKIKRSPMDRMLAPRRLPAESLDVTTVSTEDVRKLLAAARGWTEKLSVALPAYMGCRRHAAAQLRVKDYDPSNRMLRFQEKGGKTIWKPVPDELALMLDARLKGGGAFAGESSEQRHVTSGSVGAVTPSGEPFGPVRAPATDPDDYLIPNEASARKPQRDDRIVWLAVKRAAHRAGVDAHVHALRAAFAVFFLETHDRDVLAAKNLLGHKSLDTTMVYLRRLDRESAMETVRDLSWG